MNDAIAYAAGLAVILGSLLAMWPDDASGRLDGSVDDAGRVVNILRHDRKVQSADCSDCYSAAYGDTADECCDDAEPEKGAFSP